MSASMECVRVPDDGNCLFAALASGLMWIRKGRTPVSEVQSKRLAKKTRRRLVKELRRSWEGATEEEKSDICQGIRYDDYWSEVFEDLKEDCPSDDVLEAYLDAMSRDGVWGGELEIAKFSDAFKIRVVVFACYRGGEYQRVCTFDKDHEHEIRLLNRGEDDEGAFSGLHFDVLLPKEEIGKVVSGSSQ